VLWFPTPPCLALLALRSQTSKKRAGNKCANSLSTALIEENPSRDTNSRPDKRLISHRLWNP
jgi:hypothetical protein